MNVRAKVLHGAALAVLAGASLVAPRARAEQPAAAPYRVFRSGPSVIGPLEVAGDVVVTGAKLEIAGVVRGHLYAVDSEVVVRSTAVMLRSITMQRGILELEAGAVSPRLVALFGAGLRGAGGAILSDGEARVELARRGIAATVSATRPSTTSVALIADVLAFERFAPPEGVERAELASWDVGLGLERQRAIEDPEVLVVAGLARFTFVTDKVKGAFQRGYRGPRGTVLFSAIELADQAAAEALWRELEASIPASRIGDSVRSALGGGAHWYFVHAGRHNLLWREGRWFFAVETHLGAEGVSPAQERQLALLVAGELGSGLEALTSYPRKSGATYLEGVTE